MRRRPGISTHLIAAFFLTGATISVARAQDAVDRLDMQAHAAYDAQDYATAIKLWTQELKLDPTNATAAFNLASAYELSNQPDKALEGYNEAIRLDPNDPQAHTSRANLYYVKWYKANEGGTSDDDDAAKMMADFDDLVRIKPATESYLLRANAARNLHKYDKAIEDYNRILQADPKYWQAYQFIGETYAVQADWDKAIDNFNQALKLEPGATGVLQLRATAWLQKDEWDKVIDDANAVLKGGSENYEALSLRGNGYAGKGEYAKAIEDYNTIIAADEDFAEAYNAEAWLFSTCPDAKFRNGPKALELAQKACDLTEWKDPSFVDTMAAASAENGKFDEAVKFQKQAVEICRLSKDGDWMLKDLASRIPLYEQKQPYRETAKPAPSPSPSPATSPATAAQ